MNTYAILIRGKVNVDDLNLRSPYEMVLVELQQEETLVEIQTDQSGLLGMLTHLHNLGLTICSIYHKDITQDKGIPKDE